MPFDVRLPIGLLFMAIGVLVAGYGLSDDPGRFSADSAGLNIDLVWGSVMAAFGAVMLALTALARRKRRSPPD